MAHNLGNDGKLQSGEDLRKLFHILGFQVATKEEEKQRKERKWEKFIPQWRESIVNASVELAKVGIVREGDQWNFANIMGHVHWPKINGKKLNSFPSCAFNKAHGIGSETGAIQSRFELKKMFQVLGLRIATEEEEVEREEQKKAQ